jgi:hypothetical protein
MNISKSKRCGTGKKLNMFVGGEFYYDTDWFLESAGLSTGNMTFLNGGKACLIIISEYLHDQGIEKVLLPSYLCPTIVDTLESCGLVCEYYQINPDLSIDLDDLLRKALDHRAVYFINYFGFSHPRKVQDQLAGLKQKGGILIEDNAQAGFNTASIGDFVFNSMRKLCAYDGGYLLTQIDVDTYIEKYRNRPNRHLPLMREYRKKLREYLFQDADNYDELVGLYARAEKYYATDMVVEGDMQERRQIERLNWQGIKQARRENYVYLLDLLSGIPEITPVFPGLQEDNMPLGLPVYVSGISRDWLFDEMGRAGIGLTIHWEDLLRDSRLNGNAKAVEIAAKILTLVIDQRTSREQIDYMVDNLKKSIRKAIST